MKELIGKVSLKNRLTGAFEDAELYLGIDGNNLAHIEGRWRPMFEARKLEAKSSGEGISDINAEDAHWEWGKKAIAAAKDPFVYDVFVLECAGSTQGMMLTKKGGEGCFSRHPDHPRKPLVYVELLSTAPWNRPRLVAEPIYKGCGRVLLATAVSFSFDEEMEGRIGLHSLLGAEAFYRDQAGMTDLGQDANYPGRLRYFELSSSDAANAFTDPSQH